MTAFTSKPDTLRTLPLFESLTETQLTWVLPAVKHRNYPAGARIVRAGETPEGLYIILSGRVRILHEDADGRTLITGDLVSNEFFGELGLIDAAPSPASVYAVDACELAYVPRKTVVECIEGSAAAAAYMLRVVLRRLCNAHHKMGNLALMNVYGRVARVLLENGREADGDWLVETRSELIAGMVGASREMVSRVIKKMIAKGTVRRYKRKLIVLDRTALALASATHRPPDVAASR
jgi:CRP/FNR family cyclic AMP-dependent transcriptional regulator